MSKQDEFEEMSNTSMQELRSLRKQSESSAKGDSLLTNAQRVASGSMMNFQSVQFR